MYNGMPSETKHDVTSFDVHPLGAPATPEGSGQQIIVSASGKVKIGNERGKNLFGFSAVFVLKQNPADVTTAFVSSMSYRYVYKPDDSTVVV